MEIYPEIQAEMKITKKFVKIIKSAKLISLWLIWLKFTKIVKSMNICLVLSNLPFLLLHAFLDMSGQKQIFGYTAP